MSEKTKKIIRIILCALFIILMAYYWNSTHEEEADVGDDQVYVEYYFRNDNLLSEHYEKHGIEMGFEDKISYQKAASDVINNPEALHKKEKEDNDDVFFVEETGEFVVLSTDGYIRTYFIPGSGKKYFDKQ